MWRGEPNERLNCFNITDDLKDNEKVFNYVKDYYNYNRDFKNKKHFEDCWYLFIMDSCNKPMNNTIYYILQSLVDNH